METRKMGISKAMTIVVMAIACVLAFVSCERQKGSEKIVVYTSVDKPVTGKIFSEFEKETGISVRAVFDSEQYECALREVFGLGYEFLLFRHWLLLALCHTLLQIGHG